MFECKALSSIKTFIFSASTTWFGSSVPLNRTQIMESVRGKTLAEYEEIKNFEQEARKAREGEWPEYSEYTCKYTLQEDTPTATTE